jgi:hypothetical protein
MMTSFTRCLFSLFLAQFKLSKKKSEKNTIPTKVGVSLSLPQWNILCSVTEVVDELISRVKDGEPVDWGYDLGEDVYVIIKAT